MKADGSDENLKIGIGNDSNGVNQTAVYLELNRMNSKIEAHKKIEIKSEKALDLDGGVLTAYENESRTNTLFSVDPSKKKVGVGRNVDGLNSFTQTSGNIGDFDFVIGNKDGTSSSSANLALATQQSSEERAIEIELDHTNNKVNFQPYYGNLDYVFKSFAGPEALSIDTVNGATTTRSLNLTGNSVLTSPTLQISALNYQEFTGSNHGTSLYNTSISGGYFSIYNNVSNNVSFIDRDDDQGTKEDSSRGWAGITMDTTSGSETRMDFYAGGIDGSTSIASKIGNTAMRIHAAANGLSSVTVDRALYIKNLADTEDTQGITRITGPNETSSINRLLGSNLIYESANLTNIFARDINTDNLAAGNIFASSGLGLVTVKGRLDINEEDGDPASINLHRGQGNGIQLLNSEGSKLSVRATNHSNNSANFTYTGDPVLFELDHAAERITLGGNVYANSGIYQGDLEVNANLSTNAITSSTGVISTLTSTSATVNSLTASTLDVEGQTVKVSPATAFDCTISGVTRPGYLVVASGSNYYIGQGELGLATNDFPGIEIMTAPADPTMPVNFRITDINPHSDTLLAKDRITMEWGFRKIVGAEGPDHAIGGVTYKTFGPVTGDTIDLADNTKATQVSGRYLRMPSGKKHKVIAWDNSTKYFTLDTTYNDSESSDASNPAKLVDHGESYTLNILKLEGSTAVPWQSFTLGLEFIDNPRYVLDLELNESYYFSLVTTINTKTAPSLLMPSGVFDPDSNAGGQGLTEYGVPFVNKLPYLTTLPTLSDHLTVNATQFGFTVTVNGWGSTDFGQTLNTDANQIAHQFEVGYTTADTFDWASSNTVRTTMPFVSANNFPIANIYDSDTYTVAVRPLQNTQVVYDESKNGIIKKSILAGGGGVPPNMQVIVDNPFTLTTYSGTYQGQFNSGTYDIITLSGVAFSPDPLTGAVTVGFNQMSANSGGNFSVFQSASLSEHTILSNGQFDGLNTGNEGGTGVSTVTLQVVGTAASEFHATSTDFTIGTTESARKLFETQLEADYTLKKIVVDVDYATGVSGADPGIIRVYPKGNPAAGDSIQITASQGLFSQSIDLQINTNIEANRTIVVDAFDTSGSPNNNWSGTGRVWIYGQPYDSNLNQNQNTGGTVA